MLRLASITLALLTTLAAVSCTFSPAIDAEGNVTIRKPGAIIRAHGESEFAHMKKTKKTTRDPVYTDRVRRVATRLCSVINMPDADWEFVIFKDHSPNAFCLAGGKVGINTGLFRVIGDDDALLAAVLGHEISHATSNHAEHRMYRALALAIGAAIIWQATEKNGTSDAAQAVAAYTLAAYLLDNLPSSRKQEHESDKIGAIFMAKAGYNPNKSVELWRLLHAYHKKHGGRKPEFLRTHPLDEKRIKALEAFMPVAMRHFRDSKN